ncbi:hypothetical protein B0H11DRAFT_2089634 [Mycena galericulata]|nr:hypothetical protein B0H11DRAFT_2089634 [Mycena galericulata]
MELPWPIGFFSASVGGGSVAAGRALKAGASKRVWLGPLGPVIARAFEQATYANDPTPLAPRLLRFTQTFDVRWDPRMKAFVLYGKPCTSDAALWRKITDLISAETIVNGYFAFKPLADTKRSTLEPRCVICKNDTHFASACSFTHDPLWWGPTGQLSTFTEGRLAGGNGRGGRGGPRGGNGGNRGGNRGRGGRGRGRGN